MRTCALCRAAVSAFSLLRRRKAFWIAASGPRSSWQTVARNSSLRRSVVPSSSTHNGGGQSLSGVIPVRSMRRLDSTKFFIRHRYSKAYKQQLTFRREFPPLTHMHLRSLANLDRGRNSFRAVSHIATPARTRAPDDPFDSSTGVLESEVLEPLTAPCSLAL